MSRAYPHITKEIDADVAMAVIKSIVGQYTGEEPLCSYELKGVSERTSLGDVLTSTVKSKNHRPRLYFSLKRDSIYHILPEYLFHPLDRYLGTEGDSEEFDKRYKEQEEQERSALIYFRPFDAKYQELRIAYQQWLDNHVFMNNQFIAGYLTKGYPYNRENPFIHAVIPCLPWIRNYRGNEGMITTSLRYVFCGNAEIMKMGIEIPISLTGDVHFTLDGTIDDLYCGASSIVLQRVWQVRYQTEIKTKDDLLKLQCLVGEFRQFYQEWFLSVEEVLEIEFGDWTAWPILSSCQSDRGVFLNYSTQLV